jgi:hypothetical protein
VGNDLTLESFCVVKDELEFVGSQSFDVRHMQVYRAADLQELVLDVLLEFKRPERVRQQGLNR